MKTIVIAEIGENHIGDINIAKKLIRQAAEAGSDYVKFQSYRPETFKRDDPEYDWFKKVSLSDKDHHALLVYAGECGIKFLSSPFSAERARFLCEGLHLKSIKIASGVILNFQMLDYINTMADTVFLSTGMATIQDIEKSISHLQKVRDVYILHCTTQYPCEDKDANLRAIATLKASFPRLRIGYSDHTRGIEACLAASALGAEVIEKHFTFDKNCKEGTDHLISADFDDMKSLVKNIRKIETLLGTSEKAPTPGERKIKDFVRGRFV